ncbi:MAG: OmpA family protein [Bacteroidales bacterium]|nr:OmpA family protein [Bacteroidales bacterium]
MKNLILTVCLLFGGLMTTSAQVQSIDCDNIQQNAKAISTSRFLDNTYVGLSGTVSTALQFDPFLPVQGDVSIRLGKWFTPALGFNIEGTMGFGTPSLWLYYLNKNVVRTSNLGVNVDVDLFQAVRFKPERKFTMIAEAGLGWLHGFGEGGVNDLSGKTGVMLGFNLGKGKAWQFYLEPEILWNLTNQGGKPKLIKENGQIGLEVGVTYRFKNKEKSGGKHNFVEYDITNYEENICELVDINAELATELSNKPIEIHDTLYIEVKSERTYDVTNVVFFSQGSSEVADSTVLKTIPEGKSVKVYGYASPEGSAEFNLKLSQKRADVVADYLKENGVEVISAEGLGVVGHSSNRVAVVVIVEDED